MHISCLFQLQNLLIDDIRQQKFQFWRDVVEVFLAYVFISHLLTIRITKVEFNAIELIEW